jgi:hypothetical protein
MGIIANSPDTAAIQTIVNKSHAIVGAAQPEGRNHALSGSGLTVFSRAAQ